MAQDTTQDELNNPLTPSQPKAKSPFNPTAAWDAGPAAASGAKMDPNAGQNAFDQAAKAPTGPSGIDPKLWSIYQKAGVTPAARGTGFADWQYWQDVGPSQYDRLTADLAGTGTDQPTGTPGSGAWMSSGQGAYGSPTFDAGRAAQQQSTQASISAPAAYQASAVDPQVAAQRKQLFDTLLQRSQQSLNVDPNDPTMKAQSNAYNAQTDRSTRGYLSDVAEKGGAYGNVAAETRSANESAGRSNSGFQATLMQNELTSRRAEIQNALSGMQGMLSEQDQIALQRELAQMDDVIKRLQINQQGTQFNQGMGLSYAQLDSQNGQYANNYGLTAAEQAWRQDRINRGLPV